MTEYLFAGKRVRHELRDVGSVLVHEADEIIATFVNAADAQRVLDLLPTIDEEGDITEAMPASHTGAQTHTFRLKMECVSRYTTRTTQVEARVRDIEEYSACIAYHTAGLLQGIVGDAPTPADMVAAMAEISNSRGLLEGLAGLIQDWSHELPLDQCISIEVDLDKLHAGDNGADLDDVHTRAAITHGLRTHGITVVRGSN